MQYNRFMG